jgi:23S rRNA (adenine2503-C2)-methyltransferase
MNYDATLGALRKLNSPEGAGIGARHLTVSTCGVIPMIKRFANEPEQFTLAVSLHSAVQKTRDMLMPGVKKYSLLRLYDMMGEYVDKTGRRPTYEYALIKGVNDTDAELAALCDFCKDNLAHVNIIQLNHVKGSKFLPSSDVRAQEFVRRLGNVGVEATIRNSRGSDIDAACGQLRQNVEAGLV